MVAGGAVDMGGGVGFMLGGTIEGVDVLGWKAPWVVMDVLSSCRACFARSSMSNLPR